MSSVKTIVRPAKGATSERGRMPRTYTSTTVVRIPRKQKPISQRQRRKKGRSPSCTVDSFIRRRPVEAKAQPRQTRKMPTAYSVGVRPSGSAIVVSQQKNGARRAVRCAYPKEREGSSRER